MASEPPAATFAPGARLRVGLLAALVFLMPVSRVFRLGEKEANLAASDLVMPLGILYMFGLLVTSRLRLPLAGCFFASMASIGISILVNLDISLADKGPLGMAVEFAKILVLWFHFYVIVNVIRERKDFLLALEVWIASSAMVALSGIGGSLYYQITNIQTSFSVMYRGCGTLNDCNLFVVHLALSFFLTLFYRRLTSPARFWTIPVLLLQLVGMFFGVSRGGTLAFLASLTVCWALCGFPRAKLIASLAAVALVVSASAVSDWDALLTSNPMTARLTGTTVSLNDPEAQQRRQLWEDAIEGFKQFPVFGVGRGNFLHVTTSEEIAQAHNTFLGILCETGIVGFLAYAVFVAAIVSGLARDWWLRAFHHRRIADSLLLTGLLVVALGGVTISAENYRGAWILLALVQRYRSIFLDAAGVSWNSGAAEASPHVPLHATS
jgi:O-antigen ligase